MSALERGQRVIVRRTFHRNGREYRFRRADHGTVVTPDAGTLRGRPLVEVAIDGGGLVRLFVDIVEPESVR